MNGPDYRTAAEYFRDKAHAAKRAVLDGTENPPTKTAAQRQAERKPSKPAATTLAQAAQGQPPTP